MRFLTLDDLWAQGDIEARAGRPQQALEKFDAKVAAIAKLQSQPAARRTRKKQRDAAWGPPTP